MLQRPTGLYSQMMTSPITPAVTGGRSQSGGLGAQDGGVSTGLPPVGTPIQPVTMSALFGASPTPRAETDTGKVPEDSTHASLEPRSLFQEGQTSGAATPYASATSQLGAVATTSDRAPSVSTSQVPGRSSPGVTTTLTREQRMQILRDSGVSESELQDLIDLLD